MAELKPEPTAKLIDASSELLEALTWALTQIHEDLDPDDRERFKAAKKLVRILGNSPPSTRITPL
jgi:hypothetical protein